MPANWLAFARDDLGAAESLIQSRHYSIACFHCQQTVEKALKAFLLHNGRVPPHTHNLHDLLNHCCAFDAALNTFQAGCAVLNLFYMPTRYPGFVGTVTFTPPDPAQAQRALDYARTILNAIETRIFPPRPPAP
ncbi:HEPN domain-containing protein [Candidatus Poribacteria bacterium]|nr:HEPN domain-containing protein [Candidatus Poribacteria bacterium]